MQSDRRDQTWPIVQRLNYVPEGKCVWNFTRGAVLATRVAGRGAKAREKVGGHVRGRVWPGLADVCSQHWRNVRKSTAEGTKFDKGCKPGDIFTTESDNEKGSPRRIVEIAVVCAIMSDQMISSCEMWNVSKIDPFIIAWIDSKIVLVTLDFWYENRMWIFEFECNCLSTNIIKYCNLNNFDFSFAILEIAKIEILLLCYSLSKE